jgi:drug/metabolite transporter (DMT)-like permease
MAVTLEIKKSPPWDVRVLLAFTAIYILWGATFLAIRVAVHEIPPFFTAGLRFLTAGACLFGFMRIRGTLPPTLKEWRNLALVAMCMFVMTYGPLFWAQQYVTSSITAVIEATLPITTIVLEVFVFRTLKLQPRLGAGVLLGFCGIAVLMIHNPGQQLAIGPCLVILGAGIAWSFGGVLSGHLLLPASKPLTAGAEMMIGGTILLMLSALHGEMQPFPHITLRAAVALGYLIIFGSLIAYTAYVWLLGRMPATRVASHAYVNPIVALALGYFFGGEIITPRTVTASILVLVSVFLLLSQHPVVVGRNANSRS